MSNHEKCKVKQLGWRSIDARSAEAVAGDKHVGVTSDNIQECSTPSYPNNLPLGTEQEGSRRLEDLT